MREILFRGKLDDFDPKWIYGSLLSGYLENGRVQILDHDDGDLKDIIPETVGQFTGLTDKNGKKIFDGDIVKWGHLPGSEESPVRVASVEIKPDIQFNSNVGLFYFGSFAYQKTKKFLEKIGNIYDNPELLGDTA